MNMKLQLFFIGILISIKGFADGYYPEPIPEDQPWAITASVGPGKFKHLYPKNSKHTLARLAVNNEMLLTGELAWGLELGVQNGNTMRLNIPPETLAVLEWLPVRTALAPMFDLLITAKSDPLAGSSFFAQLKGGIAYRYWQVENKAIKDFSQLTGEIQAGFGYPLSTLASLNLIYQGVFGGDPNLKINIYSKNGAITNIPTLHALLLGLSVNI
ncbi:MAG: hypothetical protein PSV35_05650 [bacterium]|nr:hypothetical protein [bacterium]